MYNIYIYNYNNNNDNNKKKKIIIIIITYNNNNIYIYIYYPQIDPICGFCWAILTGVSRPGHLGSPAKAGCPNHRVSQQTPGAEHEMPVVGR